MREVVNLFTAADKPGSNEVFEELLSGGKFRLERIVSTGQSTPLDDWYDQEDDEWVVLLAGAARLRFEGQANEIELRPGDYINIPAHCRHRVEWTDPAQSSVWLALHFQTDEIGLEAK